MKLSDYIIDFLAAEGVTHIFEVCGGALAHLLDSLYGIEDISKVSMHHEMAASIDAEGYARARESIGVAMATSGPGATNMITGIGSCFFDSTPCLFITGQVNTYEFKFDLPVRQIGFQETDIVSIVKTIVKSALLLEDEREVRRQLESAVRTAKQGRPEPVLQDIPLNIQRAEIDPESLEPYVNPKSHTNPEPYADNADPERKLDDSALNQIADLMRKSKRPIILAGGVRLSRSQDRLLDLVHRAEIPVVT
jgi:acetolactate synthase I/II/III large subunit